MFFKSNFKKVYFRALNYFFKTLSQTQLMKNTSYKLMIFALLFLFSTNKNIAQDAKTDAANLQTETSTLKTAAIDTSAHHWKKGGIVTLNGQEVSLDNWAAGGQGALSVGGQVNTFFNYHKNNIIWNNTINLAYGVIKQSSNKYWLKTDDRIQLTSKVGKKAFEKAYYSILGDFKTQFAPGYNNATQSVRISNFMAPAYAILALGMDVEVDTSLSFFISPATSRITIVDDDSLAKIGSYGVQAQVMDASGNVITPYKKIRSQVGGYAKIQYRRNIMQNVSLGTTLELFSDYFHSPDVLYVNWTTFFVMKVNKYISATFNTQLIYDPAVKIKQTDGTTIGPRVQFKQILGVGFAYKF